MIIVFEGHDGVGKTSVINYVKRLLQLDGKYVSTVKNPSKIYDDVREGINKNLKASFCFSYSASMFAMFEAEKLKMMNYDIILMDRYYYSTIVSHIARGMNVNLEDFKVFFEPDIAFWIQTSEKTRKERLLSRKENYEHDMKTLNKDLISRADSVYESFDFIKINNELNLDIVALDIYKKIVENY